MGLRHGRGATGNDIWQEIGTLLPRGQGHFVGWILLHFGAGMGLRSMVLIWRTFHGLRVSFRQEFGCFLRRSPLVVSFCSSLLLFCLVSFLLVVLSRVVGCRDSAWHVCRGALALIAHSHSR